MINEEKLPLKEKLYFSFAGMGQNMIYNFTVTYIMIFYTDVLKLLPAAVGTLLLVARIWDAVNDPIMGSIVDNTRSSKGKLRPYLFAIPIPMAVFTILCFVAPQLSYGMRLLYAYVTYIMWDMVFTVSDIPYWGLSAAITHNPKERLSLVTYSRIFCNLGMAISIVLPPIMIASMGSGANGYFWAAVLMSTVGGGLFYFASLGTKERVIDKSKPSTFKENINMIIHNKPLIILQLSRFLGAFRMVIGTAGTYFAKYNLGNEGYFSLLGGILIASMIVAMMITPFFTKRFSKKTMYIASLALGGVVHLIMFFVGYGNMTLTFVLLFFVGMSLGMNDVITYALVGDSVDYLQWKTNKRTEGLCFSMHTFTTKLQSAFGLFWIGVVLSFVGYVNNASQSASALQGIFSLLSIFPAIACVLSIIPMFFFDFTEKKHAEILEEISNRPFIDMDTAE